MQLTIIKKNKLSVFILPEKINGSHWITDFENGKKINLINIEATPNGWSLISNNDVYAVNNNDEKVPNAILKENNFYLIKNNYKNEKYYLYCSPVYDSTYQEVKINDQITIGSDNSCEICYKLITNRAFTIKKEDKSYSLILNDMQSSVYLNQKRLLKTQKIEYGDIIFVFGLKIILMRKNSYDYLLVNTPNNMLKINIPFEQVTKTPSSFKEDNSELSEDIHQEDNYFYRTPRFYQTSNTYELNIDNPPNKKEDDKTPIILTVGPMLTMSMVSVVMLTSTFYSVSKGERDMSSAISSIVMSGAMLASCLLWPIITKSYQKFSDKRYEKKRQKLYYKYIANKEQEIINNTEYQRRSILDNNLTVKDTQSIILSHNMKLWQKRITDEDFLTLPIGLGNMPMNIKIKYPEEHFTMSEDNLLKIAYDLGKKERILENVPITFSFYTTIATGIVGNPLITKEFIDRLILQIMANYSYDEVKIATFTNEDNETNWDYLKILPHSWANDKSIRFFGTSNEEYREIMYVLEKTYNERKNLDITNERPMPHYVIITDVIKLIDNYDFIKDIMTNENNYGFSIIMLVDKVSALPNECKSFINVSNDECAIFSSVINNEVQKFKIDFSPIDEIYNCAKELANTAIDIKTDTEMSLPDVYQFLEMYQVGKVEQLNSFERWKKSNPILSLQAPVGIGKNGEIITLDLHEKYHGPHGLIAGTTGSGKSEFIITYILSLAINYHPDEVQIILIDYKGGSLAGAFVNDMYQLPHIAGTITNLDGNELNRSLASIESEIKRRQKEFNEARALTNESTIDIYKYQKLYREGKLEGKAPIAHLFIISDEFAELKEQQPEFMEKLISAARVGRSLGIHLILATQKPGGVVDPQIWSNTRFRVCLKVQDTGDSQEVLKRPDAAYLKKTGRFYLQVGYDEVFTLGQSAWAGGQYYPNPTFKKENDTSVNAINNIGFVTVSKDAKIIEKTQTLGEELPNIVKYINEVANQENISIRKLWLDKIPEKIYIDSLKRKYNFIPKPYYLNPIIGEYDDPASQNQHALYLPLSEEGNAVVYGIADSGKENLLMALLYSSITSYKPEEINFYIMDFGAETLRAFAKAPMVGDIVYLNEEDKLTNLFKLLYSELDTRKNKFASFGGNYQNYINASPEKVPNLVIIINNYEAFIENYEDKLEELNQLTREGFKYGIYFVITVSNDSSIRLKIKQNLSLTYVLQQNSDDEYSNILGNVRGKIPAKYKGRGLFKKDNIYEFQTAYVTNQEDSITYIKNICEEAAQNTTYRAKRIPVLPNKVDFEYIKDELINDANIIVGVNKNKLIIEKYHLFKNAINLVCSYELENTFNFTNAIINQISYFNTYNIIFINSTEQVFNNNNLNGKIITKNFDELLTNIATYIDNVYKLYEQNNFDSNILANQKKYVCFIYGVNNFINKLNRESKNKLTTLMKTDNDLGLISFIFIDTPDVIKNFSYDDWFKNGCDSTKGIWIGSGITEQTLLKITKFDREDREEITNEYGYVIQNGKLNKVKLLSSFDPNSENER